MTPNKTIILRKLCFTKYVILYHNESLHILTIDNHIIMLYYGTTAYNNINESELSCDELHCLFEKLLVFLIVFTTLIAYAWDVS